MQSKWRQSRGYMMDKWKYYAIIVKIYLTTIIFKTALIIIKDAHRISYSPTDGTW